MKRFTRSGSGLALLAEAENEQGVVGCGLWHPDLYQATAVPAVSIAAGLSRNPGLEAGFGYLGDWADRVPGFENELERGGFRIHWKGPQAVDNANES